MNGQMTERLITKEEAARQLGVSPKTLWRMTEPRGPVRRVKLPGSRLVRYSPDWIREFIRQRGGGAFPAQSPPGN